MRRLFLAALSVLVLGALWGGCRALKDDAPSQGPAPAATPSSTATSAPQTPAPSPPPVHSQAPTEITPELRLDLVREALARTVFAQIDLKSLSFHKDDAQSIVSIGFSTEIGKSEFKQVLSEPNRGQLHVLATGNYQKMVTASGPQLLYLNPIVVDLEYSAYSPQTLCLPNLQISGRVRCTLALIYGYAADVIDVSGQCRSHTNGVPDNLQLALGNEVHRVRYDIAVKGHGAGREFKIYQWSGTASVDGKEVDLTQIPIPVNQCGK